MFPDWLWALLWTFSVCIFCVHRTLGCTLHLRILPLSFFSSALKDKTFFFLSFLLAFVGTSLGISFYESRTFLNITVPLLCPNIWKYPLFMTCTPRPVKILSAARFIFGLKLVKLIGHILLPLFFWLFLNFIRNLFWVLFCVLSLFTFSLPGIFQGAQVVAFFRISLGISFSFRPPEVAFGPLSGQSFLSFGHLLPCWVLASRSSCASFCVSISGLRIIIVNLLVGLRLRHHLLVDCWVRFRSFGGGSPFPFLFSPRNLFCGDFLAPQDGSEVFAFAAVPFLLDSVRSSVFCLVSVVSF